MNRQINGQINWMDYGQYIVSSQTFAIILAHYKDMDFKCVCPGTLRHNGGYVYYKVDDFGNVMFQNHM